MLTDHIINPCSREGLKILKLYLQSFPKIERHHIWELLFANNRSIHDSMSHFLCLCENGETVGMAYMILYHDIAYLLYFAILPELRNQGRGADWLKYLKHKFKDKDIVLLIEDTLLDCNDHDLRIRRKNFYLRNGMQETRYLQPTENGTVRYEIICSCTDFNLDEYQEFIDHYPFANTLSQPYPY